MNLASQPLRIRRCACESILRALCEFRHVELCTANGAIEHCRVAGVSPRRKVLNIIGSGGVVRSISYINISFIDAREEITNSECRWNVEFADEKHQKILEAQVDPKYHVKCRDAWLCVLKRYAYGQRERNAA